MDSNHRCFFVADLQSAAFAARQPTHALHSISAVITMEVKLGYIRNYLDTHFSRVHYS